MLTLLLFMWLSGEAPPAHASPPSDLTESALRGEIIARRSCASCHAVSLDDVSLNPKAPPLRDVPDRYPVENLEESLARGIYVAHGSPMPPFRMPADEIADLTAYLRKLHDERKPRP